MTSAHVMYVLRNIAAITVYSLLQYLRILVYYRNIYQLITEFYFVIIKFTSNYSTVICATFLNRNILNALLILKVFRIRSVLSACCSQILRIIPAVPFFRLLSSYSQ
jgi:hypothetical protein